MEAAERAAAGGGRGGGSGDEQEGDPLRKKTRYHRHTARQIQDLEAMFKECPHPDEKQRLNLSRELGLEPRQIKFWFQNRRTQMKAQLERADNCVLRAENDRIRCENIAIREALKNVICPSCGGPPVGEDPHFDEQQLRIENARLKAELDRVSDIAAKYIGRPVSQLPPIQPLAMSPLDLTVGSSGAQGMGSCSTDLHLIQGRSYSATSPPQKQRISDTERSLMAGIATNAMEEMIKILQMDEPLWIRSTTNGREVLSLDVYERIFPKGNLMKSPDIHIEASRDLGPVPMSDLALVDIFMDSTKWMEFFPTIISTARILEVLANGVTGNHNGTLQLMYVEMQVPSPLVSTREFYFLRYSQQIGHCFWAVADVSVDFSGVNEVDAPHSRRRPSGCLIQGMPSGFSKVTWLEHVEVKEKIQVHQIYRDLIHGGMAYGAQRWLATLQRMCERFSYLMVTGLCTRDLGDSVTQSTAGRQSMMKLAQRMISSFCLCLSASNARRWTLLSGLNDAEVRVTVYKSSEVGQPCGVILGAATSLWLPVSPQTVFDFFRDERNRAQWDVLSNGNSVQEVMHIANGSYPGNCVSVLRALNTSQNNMLILQESCSDSFGSMVVYSPVDLPAVNLAMSGENSSNIPLLPSGFIILPDGRLDMLSGAYLSSPRLQGNATSSSGSLVTVAFQILVSSLPSAKLNLESVTTVNNLISTTVHQIKAALNCTDV